MGVLVILLVGFVGGFIYLNVFYDDGSEEEEEEESEETGAQILCLETAYDAPEAAAVIGAPAAAVPCSAAVTCA